jgi:hypothetical protein
MDQSVMVFAGTAARGSAIPSPSEGMVTYRSDDDLVEVYNGTSFVPVGGILQVVSTTKTDKFSSSSTSFTDLTGLSVSITPQSTSSKVLIFWSITASNNNNSGGVHLLITDAGNTAITRADAGDGQTQATNGFESIDNRQNANVLAGHFLWSPASTSAQTVKARVQTNGTGFMTINSTGLDNATAAFPRSVSTLTVMEVAG